MTGICQSVKGSCNLFIEPQLTNFLVFYNLPRVFQIFAAYHSTWRYQLSGKSRIDRWMLTLEIPQQSKWLFLQFYKRSNPRLGIIIADGLVIPKIYYITWNCFCKKVTDKYKNILLLGIFKNQIFIFTDFGRSSFVLTIGSSSAKYFNFLAQHAL